MKAKINATNNAVPRGIRHNETRGVYFIVLQAKFSRRRIKFLHCCRWQKVKFFS